MRQPPYPFQNPVPKRVRAGLLLAIVIGVTLIISVLSALFEEPGTVELVMATTEPYAEVVEFEEPSVEAEPTRKSQANVVYEDAYTIISKVFTSSSTQEWNAYARSLVGKQIAWTGTVASIHSEDELWITLHEPAPANVPQVALHLQDPISGIQPEQSLSFSGSISRIVVFGRDLIIHIENGQIGRQE